MPRRAIISGDNLAVVRYGAGLGRLRREAMFSRLDGRIGALLSRGWQLTWRAVRRRLNRAADARATGGVRWAGALLAGAVRGEGLSSWRVGPGPPHEPSGP